jgi:hypothetical protein
MGHPDSKPALGNYDWSDFREAFDDLDGADMRLEAKERAASGNRREARELLDRWLDKGSKIKHWPNVSKSRIRRGMRARILNPDLIKQGPTGLCGPAAFMRSLAREDACEFARFGGRLYSQGFADLGRRGKVFKKVAPSAPTRLSRVPPEMDHTDWLLLASLRDAYNDVFEYAWNDINQMSGMTVSTMAASFRGAGYSEVDENLGGSSIFTGSVNKGLTSIEQANSYFRREFQVFLLIDANLLQIGGPGIEPWANHWVVLSSPIDVNRVWKPWSKNELSRIGVKGKVWSWGQYEETKKQDAYRTFPLRPPYPDYMAFETFMRCYYGFVAAKP